MLAGVGEYASDLGLRGHRFGVGSRRGGQQGSHQLGGYRAGRGRRMAVGELVCGRGELAEVAAEDREERAGVQVSRRVPQRGGGHAEFVEIDLVGQGPARFQPAELIRVPLVDEHQAPWPDGLPAACLAKECPAAGLGGDHQVGRAATADPRLVAAQPDARRVSCEEHPAAELPDLYPCGHLAAAGGASHLGRHGHRSEGLVQRLQPLGRRDRGRVQDEQSDHLPPPALFLHDHTRVKTVNSSRAPSGCACAIAGPQCAASASP